MDLPPLADQPTHSPLRHRASRRDFLRVAGALGAVGTVGATVGPLTASSVRHRHVLAHAPVDFGDPRMRIQHLLRRTGFAPTEDEVARALDEGESATIERIVQPPSMSGVPRVLPAMMGDDDPGDEERLVRWWYRRMLSSDRPHEEKLTLFWHGWHVSGVDKAEPRLLFRQLAFQRRNAMGNFDEILKGISREPAMLVYLDNDPNVVGKPNENWARELMELFSLGVGNYTEHDVSEAARCFTGYSYDYESGDFVFADYEHDNESKTVLGYSGNLYGDDIIDIIVREEACAWHVARRVWSRFIYPGPEDDVLLPLVEAFRSSGFSMQAVFRHALHHPAFYSERAYRALVKTPVEYTVGAVRQLGMNVKPEEVAWRAENMGQRPGSPPNVAGWPGGRAWLGTGQFLARVNAIDDLFFDGAEVEFDPEGFLHRNNLSTSGELVDYLAALALDGILEPTAREALIEYASARAGAAHSLESFTDEERDLRVRGAAYLVFASPEYHLA